MTTPNDPFSTPASGFVKITDYKDQALIVTPRQYVTGLVTEYTRPGETSDAMDVDLVVLAADGTVQEFTAVRVFQGGLIGQFRRQLGQMVLGRLAQVQAKKPGAYPAWVFQPATDTDKALAMSYWTRKTAGQFSTPAPAPQAAAPAADPFAA